MRSHLAAVALTLLVGACTDPQPASHRAEVTFGSWTLYIEQEEPYGKDGCVFRLFNERGSKVAERFVPSNKRFTYQRANASDISMICTYTSRALELDI
jgi:hypothetical protein